MNTKITSKAIICLMMLQIAVSAVSCIQEKDLYKGDPDPTDPTNPTDPTYPIYPAYLYSFKDEVQNVTAEITIQTNKDINANSMVSQVPYLKFNKSWLLMLTQDDCKQAAYCRTWAAINGRPVASSEQYPTAPDPRSLYYDAAQAYASDFPPLILQTNKTLGSTDGNGNEVRFSITTTLTPEANWMSAKTDINPGFTNNYYRFYMKSGLVWDNVLEMLNYGTGIAFHDVDASNVSDPSDILTHYSIAQNIILEKLAGRGCKMLAEPNGNKTYVNAALQYPDIQTMVAQAGADRLYPFKVSDDLKGKLLYREFNDSPEHFKGMIETQLQKSKLEREAIHIGVHGTDNAWVEFLQWVNDKYGKEGDDSVWFPSQEEYYEYNYYRTHGNINIEQVNQNTIKVKVTIPSGKYFYYPSLSVNLTGIKKEDITSVSSNNTVTGFSYGNYENGLTVNIDCRKYLPNHATHFVEEYEKEKSNKSRKADALYFTNMLKESPEKAQLLKRAE